MPELGPAPQTVPCGSCGKPIDALRAPRVRCIGEELLFFCSPEHAESFIPSPALPSLETPSPPPLEPPLAAEPRRALPSAVSATPAPPLPAQSSPEPVASKPPWPAASKPPGGGGDAQDALLLGLVTISGIFSLGLLLAGNGNAVHTARLVVVVAGTSVLLAQFLLSRPDPRKLDRASLLGGPTIATVVAVLAYLSDHPAEASALSTAGALIAASGCISLLVQRVLGPIDQARRGLESALDLPARRLNGHLTSHCAARELRPGEEVLVEAGELVPADGTVVAGRAEILPWLGSQKSETRSEGDPLLAGARVVDGALRIVAGWTGLDRAWLRLTTDPRRRADLCSTAARIGYLTAQRGALAAALLVLLAGLLMGLDGLSLLLAAAAAHAAFAHSAIAELPAARMAKASLEALQHGIAFRTAADLDEAGKVTVVALCARGTVLLGEPEVAGIEPLDQISPEELLSLAAGAEASVHHPVATAVLRAARARGVRPDATRNHNPVSGLGVTAVTATGKSLIVGSRALLLREKISVARAERRITELESMGRSALLVAVDGHLSGMLALQDGLRPGARAAVQHLLDLGVEPVLLSGDSRETTDAIARSIDIEHVRPELPAAQRGNEIEQLADGGAVVCVVGRSPVDDIALSAADVSITLRAAAATHADFRVGLATDDVRDAARALKLARRARDGARAALALAVVPPTLATLALAFGLLPPVLAPGAALLGALAAYFHGRED